MQLLINADNVIKLIKELAPGIDSEQKVRIHYVWTNSVGESWFLVTLSVRQAKDLIANLRLSNWLQVQEHYDHH